MTSMWYLLIIIFGLSGIITATNQSVLITDLFTNYHAAVIPRCTGSQQAVDVYVGMAVRQIIDMNEPTQILNMNAWMRLRWFDCRLTWNASEYGGIDTLVLPYDHLWVPDIALYDNAEDVLKGVKEYRAGVSSNGIVTYNFPTIVDIMCKVDVTYFPFDTQTCPMEFGSWAYHGLDLNMINSTATGDRSSFKSNAEWSLMDIPVKRRVVYYSCCPEPYVSVTFDITIKRKPLYYVFNLLFPCILITSMAMLGFILPPDAGEKVSLEMTVLLALSVFMLIVSESLPPTSDTLPFIGLYFACAMIMVSLSTILTVCVLNVHFKGQNGRPVPAFIRKLFLGRLAKILLVTNYTDIKVEPLSLKTNDKVNWVGNKPQTPIKDGTLNYGSSNGLNADTKSVKIRGNGMNGINKTCEPELLPYKEPLLEIMHEQLKIMKKEEQDLDDRKEQDKLNADWKGVAMVMDRLFLVVFFLFTLTTTSGILLRCILQ